MSINSAQPTDVVPQNTIDVPPPVLSQFKWKMLPSMDKPPVLQSLLVDSTQGKRKIIIINGTPFYQSTGENSGFDKTWFPFLGVQESRVLPETYRGWLQKPYAEKMPILDEFKIDKVTQSRFGNIQ